MYNEKVMCKFKNPENMGEVENADGKGRVGNPTCGDVMEVTIKVEEVDGKEIIADIKVMTFGCVAAIATSSQMTEMVKGKSIEEVLKYTKNDVSEELGGLPALKDHCSNLSIEALQKAIEDYKNKKAL